MQLEKLFFLWYPRLGEKNETNHLFFHLKWQLKSKLHGNSLSNERLSQDPRYKLFTNFKIVSCSYSPAM